tara:strand:- start:2877 stop:3317 length:441 start_codon:yes stop_codon:yes gene_type:complete
MKVLIVALKNLPQIVKLILAVVILILIYTMVKRTSTWLKMKNSQFQINQEQAVFEAQGQALTYAPSQYSTYAQILDSSRGYFNDDEDSIYNVFRSMKNDLDVLQLEKSYRADFGATITDFLNSVFNRTEINDVNAILAVNNIKRKY